MLLASAVVVWEWLNEHGRWRPYGPAVCHHIEAVIRNDPRSGSVVLGQVDNGLSPYIIDLQSMHQFRQDTGTIRPVRRSFYVPSSAPAQGWLWEWEGEEAGSWTAYDTEVCIALQAARDCLQSSVDLAPLGLAYVVDLKTMTQRNTQNQSSRRVRRRADMAYPLVAEPLPREGGGVKGVGGGGPTGAFLGVGVSGGFKGGLRYFKGEPEPPGLGPPCGCQQCMLVQCVKSGSRKVGSNTLSRRQSQQSQQSQQSKPPSPKTRASTLGRGQTRRNSMSNSTYSRTLPHGHAISRNTASSKRNAALFAQSLAALASGTASLSISANRPSSNKKPQSSPPSPSPTSSSVPTATLVTPASKVTSPPSPVPSPSPVVMSPQRSLACRAPLPRRSSLVGLSKPALQRIAMAQSRALIASGVPTVPVKNLNGSSPVYPALAGITGILMSAAGLPVCLTRPPRMQLHPPPVSKSDIKPVPGLGHCCRKTTKKQARKGKTSEEVVLKYFKKARTLPDLDCTICMEPLEGPSGCGGPGLGGGQRGESVGRLAQCGHQYHLQCLVTMYNNGNKDGSLQCPTCKTIYGVKTGNQPAGKMEYHVIPHSLPGHPDCKTIRIIYNITPGIQGPEHPNPGKPFTARGFPRHCYLPDSEKGRKVLSLLLEAWDRRLIFSVGTSSTTGEQDTVVWNEIHHKTEFGSNLTGHGYPDPGHLDNMLDELRVQGIMEEDSLLL